MIGLQNLEKNLNDYLEKNTELINEKFEKFEK
jgi:hypothetical protein